jgi:hypothetical protein
VRGKKHKHEGTHCDDWFEVRWCDPWVLIAVSDGGGSYKFSRVGAKVSCLTALDGLARELSGRVLRVRQAGLLEKWWGKDDGYLNAEDTAFLQTALHRAMSAALDGVKQAAQERSDSEAHRKILGRPLALEDLSGTLLLAVSTRVVVNGTEYTYAATCSVGDGMMAAITEGDPPMNLLAVPDSGEHSGETYFLTSRGRLEPGNLTTKTFSAFRPMKALMVMTDGVADDYFPPDPQMLRLYGDLVLNRVLKPSGPAVPPPPASLPPGVPEARAACESELDVLGPEPQKIKLRSAGVFADKMNRNLKELVAAPDLLQAGAAAEAPDTVQDAAERLRLWLDAYQVRGSFDDRTLVILHREVAP